MRWFVLAPLVFASGCTVDLIFPIATVRVLDAKTTQPICDAEVLVDDTPATPVKANGSTPCLYDGRYTASGTILSIKVRVSKVGYYDVEVTTTTVSPTIVLDPVR